jgi:hypothetical protein
MFLNKLPDSKKKPSQLIEVVPVQSGKGCIGKTLEYEIFLWESSRALENLLSAIAVYCDTKESVEIWVVPSKKKKDGYYLEAREGVEGFWVLGKDRWEYCTDEEGVENPLLKRKNSTPPDLRGNDDSIAVNDGAFKVASTFAGRVVPEEENNPVPEPARPNRGNVRKKDVG